MRLKPILLALAGIALIGGAAAAGVVGWMVFQPGPYGFAEGTQVELAAYRASPTGAPAELANADPATSAIPASVSNISLRRMAQTAFAISAASIGMRVSCTPVAAKTALATAGCTITVPGSPMPPEFSPLGTICTSIEGISSMRTMR